MSKQKELTQTSGSNCEDTVAGNDRKPEYGTEAETSFLDEKWQQLESVDNVRSRELRADIALLEVGTLSGGKGGEHRVRAEEEPTWHSPC